MDKNLYMIRGLPGSGKTTLAETLAALRDVAAMAADDFFYRDGVYEFDASLLHHAHQDCQVRCKNAMFVGIKNIVIHNTFTTDKEMKPYLKFAEEFGYRVTTMIVENRHGCKSVHGVPDETMEKMRDRFSVQL